MNTITIYERIKDLKKAGMSQKHMAQTLNSEGRKTPRGKKIDAKWVNMACHLIKKHGDRPIKAHAAPAKEVNRAMIIRILYSESLTDSDRIEVLKSLLK